MQCQYICAKSLQSCLTFCDSMDWSLTGSSVHGIFQARILEWVAISFSGRSSWPRDQTQISYIFCVGRGILYHYIIDRQIDKMENFTKSHMIDPGSQEYWQYDLEGVIYLSTTYQAHKKLSTN